VLDLGCGTGEDAVRLARRGVEVVAIDASAAMVTAARAKVAAAGVGERVTVRRLAIEALASVAAAEASTATTLAGPFDGAYSSFGALNCVAELAALAAGLARLVRPGGPLVLCVMGPLAPWDWLLGVARLRPSLAVRRLRPGGARWRGTVVRYPSPGRLRRAFAPWFAAERLAAVGALLPPPALGAWAARHPRLVDRLDRWERRGETRRPLPWLADHYLLELVRR
jgi:SAM-dependent methyltransferase